MWTSRLHTANLPERSTHIITAGGWARSGKGTSMAHLKVRLERVDRHVVLIDQGLKFRAIGDVALAARQPLDSPTVLDDFVRSSKAQEATLAVLDEVAAMSETEKRARLYTTEKSRASGKVAKVSSAHEVALRLLRTQVEDAVKAEADVVLIDGRSMERHARQFTTEGLAKFVMGWYFKCDPAIAARRSLGLFAELKDLTTDDKLRLLDETMSISERNRSDTLRGIDLDPLREPDHPYTLDLSTYYSPDSDVPFKRGYDILYRGGMVMVDTSYTNSIDEMAGPITELSMHALHFRGVVSLQDARLRVGGGES